jgi:hypothetical protein
VRQTPVYESRRGSIISWHAYRPSVAAARDHHGAAGPQCPFGRSRPRKARGENTECGTQPADKSLINRRLPPHLQPCAAASINYCYAIAPGRRTITPSPLDREHKRLVEKPGTRRPAIRAGLTSGHSCNRAFAPRRAAAPVASLNWCRGMVRMAKRRRSSGSVSKSASIKI